jgi:hypothetical protein
MHPCLTPFRYGKKDVLLWDCFTAHRELEYRFFMKSKNFPPILFFKSFRNKPSCQTESKAFLKSTKHAYIFPFVLWVTFLSIKDFKVNIWSAVLWLGKNPICEGWSILFSLRKIRSLSLRIRQKNFPRQLVILIPR